MTIRSAVVTILICTLLLAFIGAGIGYGLGTLTPGYYRSVFVQGRQPWFDPVAIGIGQGLTQGTVGGVVVGLLLVALFTWRETRLRRSATEPPQESRPGKSDSVALHPGEGSLRLHRPQEGKRSVGAVGVALTLGALFLLGIGFFFVVGFVVGQLLGTRQLEHGWYLEEKEVLTPVLAGDPAFAAVEICEESSGGVYLAGKVPTPEDLARLRSSVGRALGEHRAKDMLYAVEAKR
jgi:hypothetical protein